MLRRTRTRTVTPSRPWQAQRAETQASPGGWRGVGARLRPDVADGGASQQDRDPFIGPDRLAAQQDADNNTRGVFITLSSASGETGTGFIRVSEFSLLSSMFLRVVDLVPPDLGEET